MYSNVNLNGFLFHKNKLFSYTFGAYLMQFYNTISFFVFLKILLAVLSDFFLFHNLTIEIRKAADEKVVIVSFFRGRENFFNALAQLNPLIRGGIIYSFFFLFLVKKKKKKILKNFALSFWILFFFPYNLKLIFK